MDAETRRTRMAPVDCGIGGLMVKRLPGLGVRAGNVRQIFAAPARQIPDRAKLYADRRVAR
jgi:hypothetical protein